MGFSSFMTQDTNRSIANTHSSKPTFRVHLVDDKGNVYTENNYEGYGEFGGKFFYELLAEMNGFKSKFKKGTYEYKDDALEFGVYFSLRNDKVKYPNLVENLDGWKWVNEEPDTCPDQGFFY